MKRLSRKWTLGELKAQSRWLYGVSRGYRGSILLLTGLSAAAGLLGVWSSLLVKALIDTAAGEGQGNPAGTALLFVLNMAAVIALNAVLGILHAKARTRQSNDLQAELFRKYMAVKWQALGSRHSGDYLNRMVSDVDAVNGFLFTAVPDIISTLVQLAAAVIVLLGMEPVLALLALTVTPVFILLARLFAGPLREAAVKIQDIKGENLSLSEEAIQNVVTIRAFEQQAETCVRFSSLQNNLFAWTMRRTRLSVLSGAVQAFSWNATYILSMLWGAAQLSQKAVTYGGIAAYLQLVGQIQGPLRCLAGYIPQAVTASASIGRLAEVLELPEEVLGGSAPAFSGPLGMTFKNVRFAYKEGEGVLSGLDLEAPPGHMTALVGATGEGKSTVVRLLLGLMEPQAGTIFLTRPDGPDYPVSACTRSAFTYVQQGNTGLSGTIADNLRLARPQATQEEMESALRLACAWDFVNAFHGKLETCVGERGAGLSEGQQQRLAIARALLRDAPILILDEATSALDKQTEAQVLVNIQNALRGRTCLVITHRSAAIKLCHRVYRLEEGKAVLGKVKNKADKVRGLPESRLPYEAAPACERAEAI